MSPALSGVCWRKGVHTCWSMLTRSCSNHRAWWIAWTWCGGGQTPRKAGCGSPCGRGRNSSIPSGSGLLLQASSGCRPRSSSIKPAPWLGCGRSMQPKCAVSHQLRSFQQAAIRRIGGLHEPGEAFGGAGQATMGPRRGTYQGRLAGVSLHTELPTSSATRIAPFACTAMPTGRPRALPSASRKPVSSDCIGPEGRPWLKGTKTTS